MFDLRLGGDAHLFSALMFQPTDRNFIYLAIPIGNIFYIDLAVEKPGVLSAGMVKPGDRTRRAAPGPIL